MAQKTRMVLEKDYKISKIDDRLYGSFIEHLGRAVYTGIYQPGHPSADENGFRKDVLDLVKELNVPIVRYPGGNFVSNFRWEDSVGPERKSRLDLAWRTLEPNTFGIGEFSKWAKKANTDIMMAVNLGTRGTADALNLLEYCNLDTDSCYADLRRSHGDKDPYDIKLWCMGNEMDGSWQMGHKKAEEYGHIAAETSKAMKQMDKRIETVVCGSSSVSMPTFGKWESGVLDEAYDYVDYVSLHQYWDNKANDTADFFARTDDLDYFIKSVIATCDYVKAVKHGKKDINLSFDEWNVWYHSMDQDNSDMEDMPWRSHPHLLEDIYNYEDAIMDALALIKLMQNADRVKIACLAQLVNTIAPIMTEPGGRAWVQTIYYPFLYASRYGRGTSVRISIDSPTYACAIGDDIPYVDGAATLSKDKSEVVLFLINRDIAHDQDCQILFSNSETFSVVECVSLCGLSVDSVNTATHSPVYPVQRTDYAWTEHLLTLTLPKFSWNMVRIKIA